MESKAVKMLWRYTVVIILLLLLYSCWRRKCRYVGTTNNIMNTNPAGMEMDMFAYT